MSESYGIGVPSAATADDADGDAGDVDEEGHGGGGPAEDDNRNGVDDEQQQQQQQQGGMADEERNAQAGAAAAESEPEADGDDGHHVVVATGVTVPDGCVGPTDIEARFPLGTNEATKQLALGVIGRTIIDPHRVTALIRQDGADPDVMPRLRKKGSKRHGFAHSLLCLAVDNQTAYSVMTIDAAGSGACAFVALPKWSSDGLQAEILTALLDGGADINTTDAHPQCSKPLWVAIALGNRRAFDVFLLVARHDIDLRAADGTDMVLQLPRPRREPTAEYLQVLLSMYERLITRDPTLATEESYGENLVDAAAMLTRGQYPQPFIDSYLDLITANGADMTAVDAGFGETPMHYAAEYGSPYVADYLCRKLPADQIDRRAENGGDTPLARAAYELDKRLQAQNEDDAEMANRKMTIRTLLRAGADITGADITSITTTSSAFLWLPAAIEGRRRQRQLVLTEYAAVLNELPTAVMAAVNAALAPHRSLAALLTPRLAVGPQEAPIFGWRIASYLFDMDAAQEAIGEAIGVRHSDMARRVCAAAEHFVKSAVYQINSNREVVGGTADVGGHVVRVPQLQCFVVGGVGGRKMELREVVQRAILDEAAKWEMAGEIDNGFSKDVAAVEWGAVGWAERGRDGRETFKLLRMT
ncbi:unnamed protein product [Vitrella brassicaformis CCMP3155]|uniref:Uncharacterized protein n=1 Tax=Vitrella brassicaformis (strain CCMP3155) TaxID=1169540 RepID=A0A0G4EEI7_VITBC|nr:unnamed protein product [Vitrella brassicaformis CCMP3155]|eukprot:CEL93977.1 unnamed protein product [Vitrella brassicaformis CCMP3155]